MGANQTVATKIAVVALAIPLVIFAVLRLNPEWDRSWGTSSFHFYVVSAATLLSAGACLVLIISARTMRETRVMFLALAFFALAVLFSVHGLLTPGFIFDEAYSSLGRSPWMATLAAGVFATLSVVSVPRLSNVHGRFRTPEVIFGVSAALICGYFVISMFSPDWLKGFPTEDEWFQNTLSVASISLLSFAAWRYYQSYQFARLPGQLAVAVGLVFLAEAQISLDFGIFWQYSWWLYHGLFLVAFCTVLLGWTWEVVRAGSGSAIADGLAMRDALTQLNRGRPNDLVALADKIEHHDLETFKHTDRVAAFAYAIGREIGFSAARQRELVLAAQMHDVGKIGLPHHILTKPGPLTEDEWTYIRQHPGKGFDILSRMRNMEGIAVVIRHHHERYDGTGYPDGSAGEQIPLDARIISVADTFDALTSERPYRAAMTIEQACNELRNVAGSQLDPELVAVVVRLIENGTLRARQNPPVPELEQLPEAV